MSKVETRPARLFPNYMQMRSIMPTWFWHIARFISVSTTLAVSVLLFIQPQLGLFLFWRIAIPLLPALFFLAPGLWRNICPLAATNQIPRLLKFSRGLTLPGWLREYYFVIGMGMFIVLVATRKVIFNNNGPALGVLLLVILASAFTGGVLFKGKSGWCSTICPLLPVQRLYGQTPFATIRNSHCSPCVGCVKNCYDFNPHLATLSDLHENDPRYSAHRKFFAGAFPGVIAAFYLVPNPPDISVPSMYSSFAFYILLGVGSFHLLDCMLKLTPGRLVALYGALALNLYYWFTLPLLLSAFMSAPPDWITWLSRGLLLVLTIIWLARTGRKESIGLAEALLPQGAKAAPATPAAMAQVAASASPRVEVTFAPGDQPVAAEPNATILEIAEAQGLPIETGCRMGICGADPVCIKNGMENLSPISDEERATLERLGLAPSTRLACSARVKGPVSVALKPATAAESPGESLPNIPNPAPLRLPFVPNPLLKQVVIIGNGIAGVTTADYLRRYHPDCRIHLIGREQHHLYNRMAITRLVYGRSAMQGLYLMPDNWYEQHNITTWLNTRVVSIDRAQHQVRLGTGETLAYDRLVLAIGGSSTVPPITGFGMPGTFVLREAKDAMEIRDYAQEHNSRRALVAGGGLLGLEAAYALHKLGLEVSVLERSDRLLRRQLDHRASHIVRDYLEGNGISVIPETEAEQVEGEDSVRRVLLKDGRTLECDLLLVAAGVTSNSKLARVAGLTVRNGVVVDDRMRTSDPSIYAVGDAAEHNGQTYGLWAAAVDQGKVAAINIAGGNESYSGTVPATALKVAGIDVGSIGRFEAKSPEESEIVLNTDADGSYRKLVVADGKLVGAILIGCPRDLSVVTQAVKERREASHLIDQLAA